MQLHDRVWYQPSLTWLSALLLPFSWLFGLIVALRRFCYRYHILPSYRCDVPVIVVGNITAGGTGKTPCVMALTRQLLASGYRPGIVSRGAGGAKQKKPQLVTANSSVTEVGDEALLLSRMEYCPLIVCTDRVAAVRELQAKFPDCNVVICDDGLQHYRLQRDLEIVVIDGNRQFGNGQLLPAGPLREPIQRLHEVDYLISNGSVYPDAYTMTLLPLELVKLSDASIKCPTDKFKNQRVHAVAGIGNPERFFETLRRLGCDVIPHDFPDHYQYRAQDLNFPDDLPIVMTAKDAVKCASFMNDRMWYLNIMADLPLAFWQSIQAQLQAL